jgi:hypothetical protein
LRAAGALSAEALATEAALQAETRQVAEAALRAFKESLQKQYPAIATITEQPTSIEKDRLSFKYVVVIPDV